MTTDYLGFYHLETYLFDEVRSRFHRDGKLDAFDLFSIIVWKANRAKSIIGRRLTAQFTTLERAAAELTSGLSRQDSAEARLRYLMNAGGFKLAMASAILCVLWPEEFTIYDVRVCERLRGFERLKDAPATEVWTGYCAYRQAVIAGVPAHVSLRDKDRHLWGESAAKQLERDIACGFAKEEMPASSPQVTRPPIGPAK